MESNDRDNTATDTDPTIFDRSGSVDQIGGEELLLDALIAEYLNQEPLLLKRLDEAVVSHDPQAVRRASHALASSVSVFNATRAKSAARRVEELGLAGDLTGLSSAYLALQNEFRLLNAALRNPASHRAP